MASRSSRAFMLAGGCLLAAAAVLRLSLPAPAPGFASGLLVGIGVGLCVVGFVRAARQDDPDAACSPGLHRRYLREFVPAIVGYVVTMLASVWLLKHAVDAPALRALVALAPAAFLALTMRAMMRYIRDADELQRRIEVEAIGIATALVSLGYFAAGLLQSAKVIALPAAAAMIWVFPLVCAVYGVAKAVISRRYG